jgi:hypothetical protein
MTNQAPAGFDRAVEILRLDASDPNRAAMWRYGVKHALSVMLNHLTLPECTQSSSCPLHGYLRCPEPSEPVGIHVYPVSEDHLTDRGLNCWCTPYRDTVEPRVIIHRKIAK